MALFIPPQRTTREGDNKLVTKAAKKGQVASVQVKGGKGLLERIATINATVNMHLGKYKDKYEVIRDVYELSEYIDNCIKNGSMAIDTETNSLDPITCTLAGISLYTPGKKAIYVPIHHISYVTGIEVSDQIGEHWIKEQLQRLCDVEIDIIMFNAKFDIRVIKNQLGIELPCTWDGYVAARLLNENEGDGNNGLKALHKKYCLDGKGDAFAFDDLFDGIPFTHIPINTGYLYAARDAEITYELYQFQKPYFILDREECILNKLQGVASVFETIEMPLIPVIAQMEDTGVAFDFQVNDQLTEKYTEQLVEKQKAFEKVCDMYQEKIVAYRMKNPNNKLDDPINIGSPTQMAILLYDILKLSHTAKKKSERGTGEEELKTIDHPICKVILEYRSVSILLKTFITKMTGEVNPKTNRIHCSFNQLGTVTGRFSSNSPNMQNIPSHNTDIRKQFKATDGYYLIGADYSKQEMVVNAHINNDATMIKAFEEGKDIYSIIASIAYNKSYDDCCEYRADGTKNDAGKELRNNAKAITLGVCYGKGVAAIAADLGVSVKKAQEIYDKILNAFPSLANYMQRVQQEARELGYVSTIWGRKRRLPEAQLDAYEFSCEGGIHNPNFDPLSFDEDEIVTEVPQDIIDKYTTKLDKCWGFKQKQAIREELKQQGITVKDNGGYIAEAMRQALNSPIQGSAGDMIKKAMILIGTNARLKELGFRLLLTVHDELIGECLRENIKECAELFEQLMIKACDDLVVKIKCDIEITDRWYGEKIKI